jgi:epoxyqueuosine reductase
MGGVSLSELLKKRAIEIGFDLAGVAPIAAWQDLEFSRKWVEQGLGGEMRYLENPTRHDPLRLLPAAKSVICVGLIYNTDYPYSTEVSGKGARSQESDAAEPRAWISRYAWGKDYHEVMRPMLEELRAAIEAEVPGAETRAFIDTGPIVERAFARYSGIGWMGKNTCLINQEKGSWFFLGVVLTSLELEPGFPAPDRCGSCTRCLEACPTGALIEPYVMDAKRCISYFTIELKGPIPEEFRPAIGSNVFGCDICQDVCPWNNRHLSIASGESQGSDQPSGASPQPRIIGTTSRPEFQPMLVTPDRASPEDSGTRREPPTDNAQRTMDFSLFNPPLDVLAVLTEDDFRRIFRQSPVKRAKHRGWLRNLCVAMANSGDARFTPWLEKLAQGDDAMLREHAEWALERLEAVREE